MAGKFLKRFGSVGSAIATVITILTANLGLTVSAAVGIAAGLFSWLHILVFSPSFLAAWTVFLLVLWTLIGVLYLIDRRKPRKIQVHQDYRYGLTFEGLTPIYIATNSGMPDPGGLQIGLQVRNFGPGPIKYVLEECDIRLGSRTIPKYPRESVSGPMARGAGRTVRAVGFPSGSLSEFYGAGLTKGTVDFSIAYGPPDAPPIRRLRMSFDIYIALPKDGVGQIGYGDAISHETDEPISTP
jgi:hypothetical protein